MNIKMVLRIVSLLLFVNGLVMYSAYGVSWWMGDVIEVQFKLFHAATATVCCGLLSFLLFRKVHSHRIGFREGFAVVTLGWVLISVFGSLPLLMVQKFSLADAFFETVSGFTTTGASVISDIENLPKGILYWRAMTHWLGGMGIVVFSMAILPVLGLGGMQLFKAEVPGPINDQLTPKIADSAKILWMVYGLMTLAETICLKWAGMSWFDAVCHSFATMATGGFSTKNNSILYYHTPEFSNGIYIDSILTVFMFLAGCNFILHFYLLSGRRFNYFKDEEFKSYFKIILFAVVTITAFLYFCGHKGPVPYSAWYAFQNSAFTVVSVITTTGFCTGDFNLWPQYARVVLLGLMFIGGCGGSTSGGMKVSRIILLFRYAKVQLSRCFYPHMISNVQLNQSKVSSQVVHRTLSFFFIFIFVFACVAVLLTIIEPQIDFESAISASIATLGNVGPGLNVVGPATNFSSLTDPSKYLLSFSMLVGRLEIYTVLVLFLPAFWRK